MQGGKQEEGPVSPPADRYDEMSCRLHSMAQLQFSVTADDGRQESTVKRRVLKHVLNVTFLRRGNCVLCLMNRKEGVGGSCGHVQYRLDERSCVGNLFVSTSTRSVAQRHVKTPVKVCLKSSYDAGLLIKAKKSDI